MIPLRSFRLRLAGYVTALSGTVLVAFAMLVWTFHVSQEEGRFDRRLTRIARHQLEEMLHGAHHHGQEHGHGHVRVTTVPDLLVPPRFLGEHFDEVHMAAVDADGSVIARTDSWPASLPIEPLVGHVQLAVGYDDDESPKLRLIRLNEHGTTVAVAVDLARYTGAVSHVRTMLVGSVAVILVVLAAFSWLLAHRALAPIRKLTAVAEQITAEELGRRISEAGEDREFTRLIRVFNAMLERLQRSFEQAARFTADASHELKTPLTIMQGHVEIALAKAPSGSDAQRAFAAQLEEIQRLKGLAGNLLMLSRADSGLLRLDTSRVDCAAMLRDVAEDLRVLAPDLDVRVHAPESAHADVDEVLFHQALQNLASNAAKYNVEGGWVELRLDPERESIKVCVRNTGPAIAVEDRDRIFHRFVRVDAARSRDVDGIGLGLSLAREIARAHGGSLDLVSSDGGVNAFALSIPAAQRA